MGKVRVKHVWSNDRKSVGPIQIQFEHAQVSSAAVGRDISKYFEGHVYENQSPAVVSNSPNGTRKAHSVTLESDQMTYFGSTNSQLSANGGGNATKTYIAVKRKNKMEIFETTQITVSPRIKDLSYIPEKEKDPSKTKTLEERREAEANLVKAFGSKKKRVAFESREKNRVEDMNDSIHAAAREVEDTGRHEEYQDTSFLQLIPPCNREATDVQHVYRVSDILTEEELDLLEPIATQCLDSNEQQVKKWEKSQAFSDYFFSCLKWLKVRKTEARNVLSMKLVVYTELLIRYYKLKYNEIRRKIPKYPPEFPEQLVYKVYDEFSVVNALGARTRSDELKDKVCCYIIVLALLAGDYLFDVQLMTTIFQMHIRKLLILLRAVGVTTTYVAATKEYKAMLKLPLPLPVQKQSPRKKSRK